METIRQIQDQARELKRANGWQSTSPEKRMLYLASEVGELSREVIRLLDSNEPDSAKDEARANLGLEIYDCVWNLCDLANLLEINLEAAFEQKAALNRERHW